MNQKKKNVPEEQVVLKGDVTIAGPRVYITMVVG